MPRPGESLGKYQLIRRIGLGGMAEVWLARATGPGGFSKTLVVKTVLEHQAANAEFIQQFLDEARLAALLTHPNIVQIFELGEHEGTYFIAMEHVHGQDLQNIRKACAQQRIKIPMPVLARIACGVCEGLQYAHELSDDTGRRLNLVHRDVSPENVLISFDGVTKLVDFGIAKASISQVSTRAGLFKGKLHYATPEQLLGHPFDRRGDIYALGSVLYEASTGRAPIDAPSEGAMVKRILDADYPRPRQVVPSIPEDFERIILKSMAWAPEQRYATARELQGDLELFIAGAGSPTTTFEVAQFMRSLFGREAPPTTDDIQVPAEDGSRAATPDQPYGIAEPVTVRDVGPVGQAEPSASPPAPRPVDDYVEVPGARRAWTIAIAVVAAVVLAAVGGGAIWAVVRDGGDGAIARSDADGGAVDASLALDAGPAKLADARPDGMLVLLTTADGAPAPDGSAVDAAAPVADAGVPGIDADAEIPIVDAGLTVGPNDGTLVLRGSPGCVAFENRQRLASLPARIPLPAGRHEIQVRCSRGVRRSFEVQIRAGETTAESVFVRRGTLLLLVRPWAEVFVDGQRRGITPLGAIELPEGNHTVRLVNSEMRIAKTMRVRIQGGEQTTLRVRLDQE